MEGALVHHDKDLIIKALGATGIILGLKKICESYMMRAREWILGLHFSSLENVISKLFFEKSLAQHIKGGTQLSPISIDKGKWRLIELQSMMLFDGIPTILSLGLTYVFLWIIDWRGGIVMTLVIASYLSWSIFLNYKVMKEITPLEMEFKKLGHHRAERMEKVERVGTTARDLHEISAMDQQFNLLMSKDRKFWLWFIFMSLWRSLTNVGGLVIVMGIGAYRVYNGEMSIGLIYPLFTWSFGLIDNLWRLADIEHKINWNMPAVMLMIEGLSVKPEIEMEREDAIVIPRQTHRVEFRNVSHSYSGDEDKGVLKNVSFTVEPGEKVALLGPSGVGKTTVMRLLLAYMFPQQGEILIGGHDIRNINLRSFRETVGYIAQQPQIFSGTIRTNMVYGLDPDKQLTVTDEEIWGVMRLLQIDFGARLTHGLETRVGKNGLQLSGGQAQRLMIGAAVMKKPHLMIVDEATASLDSTTEREVQQGLETALQGSVSALVIAHRFSTVAKLCTKFVMLRPATEVINGYSQVEAITSSLSELHDVSPRFRQLAFDQGLRL